jgi:sulfotransferase family protein
MADGPIFIIGAMGSGSTLLRLILDSHDNIAIPRETGFMRAYNAHQFIPFKWSGRNWARRMGWTRKELDAELRHFYDRIFSRYAERQGKGRWGDKTPFHTWHVRDMARVFPDAQFVAIVRHPGGCVGSNMNRWGQTVRQATDHYRRYNREIARLAAHYADRFAVVRYEDLVLQPEAVMRELLDYLGEDWSSSVLEHHAVQAARGGRRKVEGRSLVDDPIDVARISKWTKTMEDRHRVILRRRTARLGEFYGYEVDDPAVLAPLGDGRMVALGHDIDARVAQFEDLNLREPLTPPVADRFYDPRKIKVRSAEAIAELEAKPLPGGLLRAGLAVWRRLPDPLKAVLRPVLYPVRKLLRR